MIWYPETEPLTVARELTERFTEVHGRGPAGVWAAPGRVNVIGEHVDYNAGLCLPFALPQNTFVALAKRADGQVQVRSMQLPDEQWQGSLSDIGPGRLPHWAGYAAGVTWALAPSHPELATGFDALITGHVPLGAGLSSSAALECAVAIALDEVFALGLGSSDVGRIELAAACRRAENDIVGAPTGGLDQSASLRCLAAHALLLDCRDETVRQIPFDLAGRGLELLVIDTRAHHVLADGQYAARRRDCERVAELLGVPSLREVPITSLADVEKALRSAPTAPDDLDRLVSRLRHVVTEIARVETLVALLEAGRIAEAGTLLNASHASLRDDFEVSCAELDLAVAAASEAGALGARMTGGGFGGSAIALVERPQVEAVAAHVEHAFAERGFAAPAFLRAVPSAPARRIS